MTDEFDIMPLADTAPTQFLDETGTRQFAGKVKGYVDGRTAFRVTNVAVGTDVIDVTIE